VQAIVSVGSFFSSGCRQTGQFFCHILVPLGEAEAYVVFGLELDRLILDPPATPYLPHLEHIAFLLKLACLTTAIRSALDRHCRHNRSQV
jgi:hypothetical protein